MADITQQSIDDDLLQPSVPWQGNRREVLRLTVASLVGLMFAGCKSSSSGGNVDTGAIDIPGGWSMLPAGVAAAFYNRRLLTEPTFASYHTFFTAQGFQFIPERVKLATDTPGSGPTTRDPERVPPRLVAIAPSFRRFTLNDPSHTAISIAATVIGNRILVTSCAATVNHKPFGISSFEIVEIDPQGQPVRHPIAVELLQNAPPEGIAGQLGRPTARFAPFPAGTALPEQELARRAPSSVNPEMARIAYNNILNDRFARPLYPTGAVDTLLAETPIVQKLSVVNQLFYVGAESGPCCCCCCCCCCNGSCSCCAA